MKKAKVRSKRARLNVRYLVQQADAMEKLLTPPRMVAIDLETKGLGVDLGTGPSYTGLIRADYSSLEAHLLAQHQKPPYKFLYGEGAWIATWFSPPCNVAMASYGTSNSAAEGEGILSRLDGDGDLADVWPRRKSAFTWEVGFDTAGRSSLRPRPPYCDYIGAVPCGA